VRPLTPHRYLRGLVGRLLGEAFVGGPCEVESHVMIALLPAGHVEDAPAIGRVVPASLLASPSGRAHRRMDGGCSAKESVEHFPCPHTAEVVAPEVAAPGALGSGRRGRCIEGRAQQDREHDEGEQGLHDDKPTTTEEV
jgi:hypothetical protein